MAPKKTILLLTLILFAGITAASMSISNVPSQVWLSEDSEIDFQVDYDSQCTTDREAYVSKGGERLTEYITLADNGDVNEIESQSQYGFNFSNFDGEGSYKIEAYCEKDSGNITKSRNFSSYNIVLSDLSLNYENSENTAYNDEVIEGSVVVNSESGEVSPEQISPGDLEFLNLDSEVKVTKGSSDNGEKFNFEFNASAAENLDMLKVGVEGFDVQESVDVSVEDVWQVNGLTISTDEVIPDGTVKYRNIDDLQLQFDVTRRGESYTEGVSTSSFKMEQEDLSTEEGWFTKDESGNSFTLNLDRTPTFDLEPAEKTEVDVYVENDKIGNLPVADFTVQRDVEFAGSVLNVRNNGVSTDFRVKNKDWVREFSTGESGSFSQYIESSEVDEMRIDFPESTLTLSGMEVDNPNADGLSYEYYSEVRENVDLGGLDVRPVNMAVFVSNYFFNKDEAGRNTWARMEFDTSDVSPEDIEVYECNKWTFTGEFCSGDWEKIDENDVDLTPGATWKAEFPITPRESDRFGHERGILTNAFVVGVPQGVGSSLTLEEGSVDGLPGRVQAGDEFSFSGTVIDSSTGEPVENADVSIELVSDGNDPVAPEDPISTDENGDFEYTDSIDQAGEYSVSMDVSKNPYESFSYEEDSTMEVYYQTGLTVSAGENIDLQLGESSVIDFTLENTGQSEIQDLSGELDVTGIDDQYYSWSGLGSDSLESGEELTASLELTIPSSDDVTPGQKTVTLTASGSSVDESLENSATVYATVPVQEEQDEQDSESSDTQEQNESGSPSVPGPQEVSQMTGEFVQSQSDMNLALGLILIFGAILAVTVRKRKESDGRDGRMNGRTAATAGAATGSAAGSAGGRGKVQRPKVSPEVEETQEKEEKDQAEQSGSDESEETEESEDDSDEFVCDKCGETFDTESGLKLHSQALH